MISDTLNKSNGDDRIQAVNTILSIKDSASNSTAVRELINQCTRGTEREENIHELFRCPACLGCKTCRMVRKLKCVSLNELSEQFHLRSIIKFIPGPVEGQGYYESPLPLLPDYKNNIESNFEQANTANIKLIESLQKTPQDLKAVQESYDDLVKRGFITELCNLPISEQESIGDKVNIFIPNTVAYKSQSHSTKVRICWDLSRKTGGCPPLNAQLMRGSAVFSMTRTLVAWRLRKYGISADVSKFYNNLRLRADHKNLHMSVWRPSMDVLEKARIFVLNCHFYGVASTAGLMKAVMQDAAEEADKMGLHEVAKAIRAAFVDDVNSSANTLGEVMELRDQLRAFMHNRGLPLKGIAISGERPETALSPEETVTVGGFSWHSQTDTMSLNTPEIFTGRRRKGKFLLGVRRLGTAPTMHELHEFYAGYPITLAHILSRTSMLYDQTGGASPLAGFGHYITRLAMVDTGAVFSREVSIDTKQKFLNYLFQVGAYGKLKMARNHGRAARPDEATMLAYFDAGKDGVTVIIHLCYETEVAGEYYCEFLFAVHSLSPKGRNIPHSELDGAYRASKQVANLLEWLQAQVTRKLLIGDSQIALFWLLNRQKRTTAFIRNRTHMVNRVFADEEIYYIPTKQNPADLATRFEPFENAYKKMGDTSTFRRGPEFMARGVERAIQEKHIMPITDLRFDADARLEAAGQMAEAGDSERIEITEMALLVAVGEMGVEHRVPRGMDADEREKVYGMDVSGVEEDDDPCGRAVLICGREQRSDEGNAVTRDEHIMSKIQQREEYSQYLISPTRKTYRMFFDSLTVLFKGVHTWLQGTGSGSVAQGRQEVANKWAARANDTAEGNFSLGRCVTKGAMTQKWQSARLQELERKIESVMSTTVQSPELIAEWENYKTEQSSRIDKVKMQNPNNAESIIKIQTSMLTVLENIEEKVIKCSDDSIANRFIVAEIKSLRATRYKPFNSALAANWLTYPGMLKLVQHARELDNLMHIDDTPSTEMQKEMMKEQKTMLAETIRTASAMASAQIGPIAVAIMLSVQQSLENSGETAPWVAEVMEENKHSYQFMLTKVRSVVHSDSTWPSRKRHSLGSMFKTSRQFRSWAKVTSNYVAIKASKECEKFTPKAILDKVGVNIDGKWLARHRLTGLESGKGSVMGFSTTPFLIETSSPLAWSIALHAHYVIAMEGIDGRPSANNHKSWRVVHNLSLRFGVIIGYQSMFKRIENTCITCIRRKATKIRVAGGNLHSTQLTKNLQPFRNVMCDLSGGHNFKDKDGKLHRLYALLFCCMETKLTAAIPIGGRKSADFLLAFNVMFAENGKPQNIFADAESGLIKAISEMKISLNTVMLREHQVKLVLVTARSHHPHGLIERRIKSLNRYLGQFSHKNSQVTMVQAGSYMRVAAALLNTRPYGLRFLATAGNPLMEEDSLAISTVCPNNWKFLGAGNDQIEVTGPSLEEHEKIMTERIAQLNKFHREEIIPQLMLDIDRKRTATRGELKVGMIVLFQLNGPDGVYPKQQLLKLGKITHLIQSEDGYARKATIKYSNANQLRVVKGKLVGTTESTTRQVETLTAVTEVNQDREAVTSMIDKFNVQNEELGDCENETGQVTTDTMGEIRNTESDADSEEENMSDTTGRESPEGSTDGNDGSDSIYGPGSGVQVAPTDRVTRSGTLPAGVISVCW